MAIIGKIKGFKSLFFEKINKTEASLGQLTKRKKEKTQINRIKNEQKNITADTKNF